MSLVEVRGGAANSYVAAVIQRAGALRGGCAAAVNLSALSLSSFSWSREGDCFAAMDGRLLLQAARPDRFDVDLDLGFMGPRIELVGKHFLTPKS